MPLEPTSLVSDCQCRGKEVSRSSARQLVGVGDMKTIRSSVVAGLNMGVQGKECLSTRGSP